VLRYAVAGVVVASEFPCKVFLIQRRADGYSLVCLYGRVYIYIRLCLVLCLVFINDNNNSNNPDRALVRISFFPSSPKYFFFFLIFFFCTKPLAVSSSSSSITYTYCWAYHLGLLGSDVYISNVYIYAAGQHANGVGSILLLSRRALHCTAPALYPSNMDIR
jgi:hypothetical protein